MVEYSSGLRMPVRALHGALDPRDYAARRSLTPEQCTPDDGSTTQESARLDAKEERLRGVSTGAVHEESLATQWPLRRRRTTDDE
jgi:hypothetical protein